MRTMLNSYVSPRQGGCLEYNNQEPRTIPPSGIFCRLYCFFWQVRSNRTCLGCLRRRTRSITNEWSPGCSIMCSFHGITQGHLGVFDDLVGPAGWWSSSWATPWWRWGGGQNVDGLGAGWLHHNIMISPKVVPQRLLRYEIRKHGVGPARTGSP